MRNFPSQNRLSSRLFARLGFIVLTIVLVFPAALATAAPGQEPTAGAEGAHSQTPAPEQQPLDFTEQVIQDALENLQRGLQTLSLEQTLSAYDSDAPEYAHWRDEFRAFFAQYGQIRFRYKILQSTSEKNRGSINAEVDLEAIPLSDTAAVRRSMQMQFQFRRTPKGWRVTSFTPSDFFEQLT